MNALLRMPEEKVHGNLIWMAPYVYPSELLEEAMNNLRVEGYWMSLFPEGDGITFDAKGKGHDQVERDVRYAFSWMRIHVGGSAEQLTGEQVIILPVQRLLLHKPVISRDICLFPPGEMQVQKMKLLNMRGKPFGTKADTSNLRDHITQFTNVDRSVFERQPLVVFRDPVTYEAYQRLTHMDDNELIRKYSRRADDVLDMLRFYEGDFYLPEMLPSKAGIWNDRYSAAMVYFPKYATGHIQSREVEAKNFIRGIGMEFTRSCELELHLLLHFSDDLGETGKLARHALRLFTAVQEVDDYTLKFTQAMMLLDMLMKPDGFGSFKDHKGKIIAVLARNKTDYHRLSQRFLELTGGLKNNEKPGNGLRTAIIHKGKRIEDILSTDKIKDLLHELQEYAYLLIQDMIKNYELSWEDYERTRDRRMKKVKG